MPSPIGERRRGGGTVVDGMGFGRLARGEETGYRFRMKNKDTAVAWRAVLIINTLALCTTAHMYYILVGEADSTSAKLVSLVSLVVVFLSWVF